jgi:hypothetical protein
VIEIQLRQGRDRDCQDQSNSDGRLPLTVALGRTDFIAKMHPKYPMFQLTWRWNVDSIPIRSQRNEPDKKGTEHTLIQAGGQVSPKSTAKTVTKT